MADSQIPEKLPIEMKRAEPQLLVTNIERSISFFTDKLGFKTRFVYGTPAFFAQVARDNAYINLRWVPEPIVHPTILHQEAYLAATLCVDPIDELFNELKRNEVEFYEELHTEPWGSRTFIIFDPDHSLSMFAG